MKKEKDFLIVGKDYVKQKINEKMEPIESCCSAWRRYTIKQGHTFIFCPTCLTDFKK